MTAPHPQCQPDIVERLRDGNAVVISGLFHAIPTMREAADHIEGLRKELAFAKNYVNAAIASYEGDPADNRFLKGHLAALEVVRDEAFSTGSMVSLEDQ